MQSLSLPSPDSDSKSRFSVFTAGYPDLQHDVSISSSATSDSGSDADVASAALPERPRHFIPGHFRYFCFDCHERIDARGFCDDACERKHRRAGAEDNVVAGGDDSVAETIDERPPSSASNYSTDDLDLVQTIIYVAEPPPRPLRSPLRPSYPPVFPPNDDNSSASSVVDSTD